MPTTHPSSVAIPSRAFRLSELLMLLKQDEEFAHKCSDGFEFFERMIQSQGSQEIIETLRDLRDFLNKKIDLENKHLDSGANVIFSLVEEKYYNPHLKQLFKFLDFRIWLFVGGMFTAEAIAEATKQFLEDSGNYSLAHSLESPITYFAAASLLMCAAGIIYDQYEKNVEAKILGQIRVLAEEIIKRTPKSVLDAPEEVAQTQIIHVHHYDKPRERFFPR